MLIIYVLFNNTLQPRVIYKRICLFAVIPEKNVLSFCFYLIVIIRTRVVYTIN